MEKSTDKYLNLDDVYGLLDELSNSIILDKYERTLLKRFVQKISESSSFLNVINQSFSNREKIAFSDKFKKAMTGRVELNYDYSLVYDHRRKVWDMYDGTSLFLKQLDWNLTKKIITDINVAFLIKANRNETKE